MAGSLADPVKKRPVSAEELAEKRLHETTMSKKTR